MSFRGWRTRTSGPITQLFFKTPSDRHRARISALERGFSPVTFVCPCATNRRHAQQCASTRNNWLTLLLTPEPASCYILSGCAVLHTVLWSAPFPRARVTVSFTHLPPSDGRGSRGGSVQRCRPPRRCRPRFSPIYAKFHFPMNAPPEMLSQEANTITSTALCVSSVICPFTT